MYFPLEDLHLVNTNSCYHRQSIHDHFLFKLIKFVLNVFSKTLSVKQVVIMVNGRITLHHYTSEEGAKGIEETQIIKSSTQEGSRDARFGDGVYFTDMSPEDFTGSQISNNNYQHPNAKRKLAYCVIVTMPEHSVNKCDAGKRQIFLHPGDVNLKDEKYSCIIVKSTFVEPRSLVFHAQGPPGAAASKIPGDIDAGASSYDIHLWLSQF